MSEETKNKEPKSFDELKQKINKQKKKDTESVIKQIATRDKLERDYREDLLEVTFFSSPETKRMIQAKRPTQSQMMTIMKLSAEAALYEGRMDAKSLDKMVNIYDSLNDLAAKLSVDKKLDSEFWRDKVSFATLQNFITELIKETQKGTGIQEDDMQNFR